MHRGQKFLSASSLPLTQFKSTGGAFSICKDLQQQVQNQSIVKLKRCFLRSERSINQHESDRCALA